MSSFTTKEVEDQYFQLVDRGAYVEALELVTHHADLFPDYAQAVVYFWRMDMACRLNESELALQLLEEATAAGHWYTKLDDNPNFRSLHGLPEFERLVVACEELRAAAIAGATSVLKVLEPDNRSPPYPLLLALHGNSSNVESFAGHWQAAVSHGWLVGLPQSPQAYGPDTYSWHDWDWVVPEIKKHYATLCARYPIDPQRRVLAGFSMGGGLAVWLALSGIIKVRGVIAVAPFLSDVERVQPLLEHRQGGKLQAYLVASERDEYCYSVAQKLAELLPSYGVACELEVHPDLGHSFPPPFERNVSRALEFVVQD